MKAMILAAGRGTRVQPITYARPKPMVPVLNRPIMEFLIQLLKRHGMDQIMVNTSYLANSIEDYFRDGSQFGVEIAYSFEGHTENGRIVDEPVGSAGALKKIQEQWEFFDGTFVVLCGDAIVDIDLTRLVQFHREKGALATLALATVEPDRVSNYGVAVTDAEGKILEFQEKPAEGQAKSRMVNTGVYVFEPEVIDRIPSGVSYDLGSELFAELVAEGAGIYGAKIPFQWLDIGTISDYHQVMQLALSGRVNGLSVPGKEIARGIWCGMNARVDLSRCFVTPPVYIGSNSTLEPGCTVAGPTLIGANCVVESGASIERSMVFEHTRVKSFARVFDKVVCDGYCVDPSGAIVDLVRSDMDWIIADARSPERATSAVGQQIEALLEATNGNGSIGQSGRDMYAL